MSSHIDLADPLFLDFEYMRWIAALVESRWPREQKPKLRGLHLGGGELAPWHATSTRPTLKHGR